MRKRDGYPPLIESSDDPVDPDSLERHTIEVELVEKAWNVLYMRQELAAATDAETGEDTIDLSVTIPGAKLVFNVEGRGYFLIDVGALMMAVLKAVSVEEGEEQP